MRAPSVKKLTEAFRDLTPAEAKQIRAFAKAVDDPEKLEKLVEKVPVTEAYVRQMYSSPYDSYMWRVTVALHAINEIVGGFGVEPLGESDTRHGPPFEYINMGDTYATTLIYDRDKDRLFIGTMGDVVEHEGLMNNPDSLYEAKRHLIEARKHFNQAETSEPWRAGYHYAEALADARVAAYQTGRDPAGEHVRREAQKLEAQAHTRLADMCQAGPRANPVSKTKGSLKTKLLR